MIDRHESLALLFCLSSNTPHSSPVAPLLSCPKLPPPSSPIAPLCCPVTSASCLFSWVGLHAGAQSPHFTLTPATESLSHFTHPSPLDFASSFSSCHFSMFNDLSPLLSNTGYFGLPAGMSFLVGLSSELLLIISAAITWPLHFAALVAAHFQTVRKTHAHTLSSPYLLPHVSVSCLFATSFYFATDTFRF